MNPLEEGEQGYDRLRGDVKFPDALVHLAGNRINDLVIRQRMFARDVVTLADGDIHFEATENRRGDIVHVDGLLQGIAVAKDGDNRRISDKSNQSPHVAVAWTAVDHCRTEDGVLQSAGFDGKFRRHTDSLALGVQLREDGGRADEDCALDTRFFRGMNDRVRVTEAERGDIDEGVRALHGGRQRHNIR